MTGFKLHTFFLVIFSALISGCTSFVSRDTLPPPLSNSESADTVKVVSIPLPVIAVSPNEGVTTGALSAFLLHNKKDEIDSLIAPQINRNPNFGTTASLYAAFFPSESRTIEISLSKSTDVNENYEFRFQETALSAGRNELNLYLFRIVDGSSRFFGFGSGSVPEAESNYADDEAGFNLSYGWKFGRHYQIALGERLRSVEIKSGAVSKLPGIKDQFNQNDVAGVNGFTAHAQRVSLIYSTLNMPSMATFGGYARGTFETSFNALGSSENYRHYEIDMRGYIPYPTDRLVSAFRVVYNQTLGDNVPFLERSILGGENSLRGYGRNRFIDSSSFMFNLEERIRIARWEIFGVNADWEIAPFFDAGGVSEHFTTFRSSDFVASPGVGIRAVVRPNVVGRLDLGFGNEGAALFVGLGYPY